METVEAPRSMKRRNDLMEPFAADEDHAIASAVDLTYFTCDDAEELVVLPTTQR